MKNTYVTQSRHAKRGDGFVSTVLFFRKYRLKWAAKFVSIVFQMLFSNAIPIHLLRFGEGTVFAHRGFGTIINGDTIIGKGCWIGPNVSITARNKKTPVILDNCFIGAGAIIAGGITIGENCKIGVGALVLDDIPPGSVVVNSKATIR